MLYPVRSEEPGVTSGEKLLSRHLETWGPRKNTNFVNSDGWSQLSLDSSELGNVASPFDDIGFLAGGTANMNTAPKSALNMNAGETPTEPPKPSLGNFLETSKTEVLEALEEQQQGRHNMQRRASGRLEKTISKREQFQEEEASLALSAAMAGGEKTKGARNLLDFSKNSIGISVLSGPKPKTENMEESKTLFGASKNTASKSKRKGFDNSKNSFGFGSSRSSDGSRTIGSKFSSMMRSKNDNNKLLKSEERVAELEAERQEMVMKNKRLQARLDEMVELVEKQKAVKDWTTIEELAKTTSEMWKFRSIATRADIEIEKSHGKIAAYERLVEAKERSICNLEHVRHKQEKRIGYLEVQCLQNGIDIAEDGSVAPIKLIEEAPLKEKYDGSDENEHSFASFQDDGAATFKIDYSQVQLEKLEKPRRCRDKDKDNLGRSCRSEDSTSNSIGISDLSGHSQQSAELPSKPNSWLTLDMAPEDKKDPTSVCREVRVPDEPNNVPLENFLAKSSQDSKERCLETGTWDPTNMLDFANKSPRDVGVIPPPPPPPPTVDHIRSAPAPTNRKSAAGTVISRSTRSKSPGTRRRLKNTRGDGDPLDTGISKADSSRGAGRSKSPGTRRKLKDTTSANTSSLGASSSNLGSGHRRKLRASNSFQKEMDRSSNTDGKPRRSTTKRDTGLDHNSTHSLGRGSAHRRRQRKESELDRRAVSTALENALGSSLNVLDMDDDFLQTIGSTNTTTKPAANDPKGTTDFDANASFRIRSKASKAEQTEHEGLDLDDVFQD